jgi:hypothetical protein
MSSRWEELVARLRENHADRPDGGAADDALHIVVRRAVGLGTLTYRGPYRGFEAALEAVAAELRADTAEEDHEYTIAPLTALTDE